MSALAKRIQREIETGGPIPFVRFMELALYCPQFGYYERASRAVGRAGDFYTSVSVGPLFGELLGFQFAEWLNELDEAPRPLQLVEAGAHDGRLAADILGWLQRWRPKQFAALEYWILEPSPERQQWQRETLAALGQQVRWFAGWPEFSPPVRGVIFSNELLDALPAHRLGWNAARQEWFEWAVDWSGEKFIWKQIPPTAACPLPRLPIEFLALLPDGFTTEISAVAEAWWRSAAQALHRGKLIAVDYGLTTDEFFGPQRAQGTLRAYRQHRVTDDPLAEPGGQDLTAHVQFTRVRLAGEECGLNTGQFVNQSQFLTGIFKKILEQPEKFGEWTPQRTRQFQTLTHPEHLGRPFRVLVQSR